MGGTFSLNPIDLIEKAINEHGSAEILKERLDLAKDQFVALDRKASELEREIGKLEAKLQREQLDRNQAQEELKRLQKEHEEDIRIYKNIEFRKGKRTGNTWSAFCPNCHLPAEKLEADGTAICSMLCGWHPRLKRGLDDIMAEFSSLNP
jgi:DNA repair exonuclease SbcCD ATPase subunit